MQAGHGPRAHIRSLAEGKYDGENQTKKYMTISVAIFAAIVKTVAKSWQKHTNLTGHNTTYHEVDCVSQVNASNRMIFVILKRDKKVFC